VSSEVSIWPTPMHQISASRENKGSEEKDSATLAKTGPCELLVSQVASGMIATISMMNGNERITLVRAPRNALSGFIRNSSGFADTYSNMPRGSPISTAKNIEMETMSVVSSSALYKSSMISVSLFINTGLLYAFGFGNELFQTADLPAVFLDTRHAESELHAVYVFYPPVQDADVQIKLTVELIYIVRFCIFIQKLYGDHL